MNVNEFRELCLVYGWTIRQPKFFLSCYKEKERERETGEKEREKKSPLENRNLRFRETVAQRDVNPLSVIAHGARDGQGDRAGIRISSWHAGTVGGIDRRSTGESLTRNLTEQL